MGAENIRHILRGEGATVEACWPRSVQLLLGEGALSLSAGRNHARGKKRLVSAFNHDSLAGYVGPMHNMVNEHVKRWSDLGSISCK